jgi:hypothetical protein
MMSRRVVAGTVVALFTLAAAALGSTAAAAANPRARTHPAPPHTDSGAVPLSPAEAEALLTAPAAIPSGETATAVSPEVALAASTQPGTEISTESGSTPAEAVGLPAQTGTSSDFGLLASFIMCWADRAWWQWGTWPYEQRITNTTFWCAAYGSHITYSATTVTTSGTLCSTNWRADQLIGGGVGFHGMTIRASAGFACPTVIPWLTLHPTHYLDVFFGDRGRAVIIGHG